MKPLRLPNNRSYLNNNLQSYNEMAFGDIINLRLITFLNQYKGLTHAIVILHYEYRCQTRCVTCRERVIRRRTRSCSWRQVQRGEYTQRRFHVQKRGLFYLVRRRRRLPGTPTKSSRSAKAVDR